MSSSRSRQATGQPTDKEVHELLSRHHCPTPLHELRTLLLGQIASPRLDASPMATLAHAWGGELPEFASAQELEEVVQVLLHGLWNRLSDHQNSRNPFRLPRFEVELTRPALHGLARQRAQELRGFADGLFGSEDEMLLPEKAHEAMSGLARLYTMFDAAAEVLVDASQPAPAGELKALLRDLQQMTISADEHINRVLQSCRRARGEHLEAMASVMSRNFVSDAANDDEDDEEPDFVESPLCQTVTRQGVTVKVDIYGDSQGKWILEVVDAQNTSHVWDDHFDTDRQALAEALRALEDDPLEFAGRNEELPLS